MATQIPRPLAMNRRQLLTTVAVVQMSGILPAQISADAVPVPSIPTSEPSPFICAATARRIEEITARNRIREEACLPLLSIPKELRRMKEADDAAAFEEFAARHRQAVCDEVLATTREARGESNWHPSGWMEGMALQAQVNKILRQRFDVSTRPTVDIPARRLLGRFCAPIRNRLHQKQPSVGSMLPGYRYLSCEVS